MDLDYFFLILICTCCITFSSSSQEKKQDFTTQNEQPKLSLVHHDYESMVAYLRRLHKTCPAITRLYSIGKSVKNRELYVMEITSNPGKHDVNKPEVKYIGNIHGNEVTGKEMLLHLIEVMCTQYGINDRITNIVNSIRLHILPSMNPDGYEMARKLVNKYPHFDSTLYTRENSEDVDLNRNFPALNEDCMSTFHREPETQAVMKWSAEIPFVLTLDLHSGSVAVIHPYGFTAEHTPDHAVFQALADSIIKNNPAMRASTFVSDDDYPDIVATANDFNSGLAITGDMQDYDYLCSNSLTISVEMNNRKYPKADKLANFWYEIGESLLAFAEMSRKGIHGFVHSSDGEPIPQVAIMIGNTTKTVLTGKDGDYWRLMVPGDYNVTASCFGYQPATKFVHVPSVDDSVSNTVILNFTLIRISDHLWTSEYDFRLHSNMAKYYLNNSELYSRFDELMRRYPRNCLDSIGKGKQYNIPRIRQWQITGNTNSDQQNKFHIALISSLYASQLIGREILLRLITHLLAGWENDDTGIKNFLDKVVVHVIPEFDSDLDEGTYDYNAKKPHGFREGLLNKSVSGNTKLMRRKLRKFLRKIDYDAVIQIVGGGIDTAYTNEFFEVFKDIALDYDKSMKKNNCRTTSIRDDIKKIIHDTYDIPVITLGLSCDNHPPSHLIPTIWQDNLLLLKRMLFRLAHGVIIRVNDESGNVIENAQIHFSRQAWRLPFHSITQKSKVFRKILPLGSVALQVSHSELLSQFISEQSHTNILIKNITALKFE